MDLAATLQFQIDMGADEALEEEPVNRLQKSDVRSQMPEEEPATVNRQPSTGSPKDIAREMADKATTLAELEAAVRAFDGCSLKKTANKTVFCDGNPDSDVMLIGEAPGANEDMEGIPFCGQSGKLLDNMLEAIDLRRKDNCYITNTLFWRPPGNRKPTPEEIDMCRPFVEKHVALFKPKVLILVGGTAVASVLQRKDSVSAMRKTVQKYTNPYMDYEVPTFIIFHPSYLLRSPGQKKTAWFDLLAIQKFLNS